jgi:predicted PhzF superfamily epimerase YddE/YHI9
VRPFSQVDVFSAEPFSGNPVAVVHDADGLSDADMATFAAGRTCPRRPSC